jgi:tetrahydromethanopterin S-methyltransferase subunit G
MHSHPLEARIARVEGAFEQVNERLGSIERRLDAVDLRFNHVDSRFNWLTGIVVGTWATTILTILFHH